MKVAFQDLDYGFLIGFAAANKLCCAVALRSNAFPTPNMWFEGSVTKNAMKNRGCQFFGTGGSGISVKEIPALPLAICQAVWHLIRREHLRLVQQSVC